MKRLHFHSHVITIVFFLAAVSGLYGQALDREQFSRRREALMERLGKRVAVFKSPGETTRNSDITYEYRQNSDFYYLTGFEEANTVFVLDPEGPNRFIMFVHPVQPMMRLWMEDRAGMEGAMDCFGADTAYAIRELNEKLGPILNRTQSVTCSSPDLEFKERLARIGLEEGAADRSIRPVPHLHAMRQIKSSEEIAMLQRAIDITCEAHREAMRTTKSGVYEYETEAVIEYIYRLHGCTRAGFPSIVGSGPNTAVLHYTHNNRRMEDGDLLVMDIGAEWEYYSADVTRTIPVSGRFTDDQKAVYSIVLLANEKIIESVRPGIAISEVYGHGIEILTRGLYDLGLITDPECAWQSRVWTIHGMGHWLGLDTHDVQGKQESTGSASILLPGMVFTVEPGIYISEGQLDLYRPFLLRAASEEEVDAFIKAVKPVAARFAPLGIRIEDDVLVTETGYRVLSLQAPKRIADIEAEMASPSRLFLPEAPE